MSTYKPLFKFCSVRATQGGLNIERHREARMKVLIHGLRTFQTAQQLQPRSLPSDIQTKSNYNSDDWVKRKFIDALTINGNYACYGHTFSVNNYYKNQRLMHQLIKNYQLASEADRAHMLNPIITNTKNGILQFCTSRLPVYGQVDFLYQTLQIRSREWGVVFNSPSEKIEKHLFIFPKDGEIKIQFFNQGALGEFAWNKDSGVDFEFLKELLLSKQVVTPFEQRTLMGLIYKKMKEHPEIKYPNISIYPPRDGFTTNRLDLSQLPSEALSLLEKIEIPYAKIANNVLDPNNHQHSDQFLIPLFFSDFLDYFADESWVLYYQSPHTQGLAQGGKGSYFKHETFTACMHPCNEKLESFKRTVNLEREEAIFLSKDHTYTIGLDKNPDKIYFDSHKKSENKEKALVLSSQSKEEKTSLAPYPSSK